MSTPKKDQNQIELNAPEVPKVVLTIEEKMIRQAKKQQENMLKSLRQQAELIFAIGFRNGKKLKAGLQTLKALSDQIESEIMPELPIE